jgi:DNA-binding MarR family transcriptional regulator
MEFFIMTLIERNGLKSLYEFREVAGLQPGGIRSAMARLEKRKFITQAEPGRRRDLALTPAGMEFLERFWGNCLRDHLDSESVLRSAMVVWLMKSPDQAAEYLRQTGDLRRKRAEEATMKAELLKRSQTDPLSAYEWMLILSETHRRHAESEAFSAISEQLKKGPDLR